jgi:small subunit ribosomal protein S16
MLRRIRALFWVALLHRLLRNESDTIMVTIRLTRRGARNQPFYHVVVTDSRKRQGGPSLEHVGFFNPIARRGEQKLKLDLPRIDYWVGKGAQPSERVRTLVSSYRKQATA